MQSEIHSRLEECQLSMATRGQLDEYLPPHLWEQLRQRLQKLYRKAIGEPMAVLSVDEALSPSPISADAVVEACAEIAYRVCAETRHVTLGDKAAAEILSLKGTFPAAPEAKSEVAVKPLDEHKTQGWMADDGRFCLPMSFGYFIKFPKDDDKTQTFMAWHYHEPVGGSSSIKTVRELAQDHHRRLIRSALVDPEGGV